MRNRRFLKPLAFHFCQDTSKPQGKSEATLGEGEEDIMVNTVVDTAENDDTPTNPRIVRRSNRNKADEKNP